MPQTKRKHFIPGFPTLSVNEQPITSEEPVGLRPSIYSGCPSYSVHVDYEYKAFERLPTYREGVAALVDHARCLYEHTNADIIVLAAQPEGGSATTYFSQGLLNDPDARRLCESFPGIFQDAIAPRREVLHIKKEILYSAQCASSPLTVPVIRVPSRHPKFPPELAEYLDYICADSELWGGIKALWEDQNTKHLRRSLNRLGLTREQKAYIELLMLQTGFASQGSHTVWHERMTAWPATLQCFDGSICAYCIQQSSAPQPHVNLNGHIFAIQYKLSMREWTAAMLVRLRLLGRLLSALAGESCGELTQTRNICQSRAGVGV
ncbi:hypothetical protein BOTBODRAFT_45310 [Botryobasidium botryosum FD-172 SS1]|uniref:Uncharacterized protein n=1 Tax=Botryobasidium botryosum (strain FD-172 SS1) TaxID=930990 RepID=A0A067MFE3_BOTB1|nr:hypothetical protein BOTBODRAFT_45310 [Botryobasidium botryosum FD-172 SS1]